MQHISYKDNRVTMISMSSNAKYLVATAMDMTMKQDTVTTEAIEACNRIIPYKFLLDAEHTSLLEHVNFTFRLKGISRSLLAQITRHRMGSFTSSSQHYQDYRDYPVVTSDKLIADKDTIVAFNTAYSRYTNLIANGVSKEEARQVLPNAAAVNLLWSVNARSLVNFLRLRLCKINVEEMQIVATKVLSQAMVVLPDLFTHVGPQCFMDGKCKQGYMTCGSPWIKPMEV
jgi:thymidylate synthase (FAD)